MTEKRVTTCKVVMVLGHVDERRGLRLLEHATRCVRRGEIHELVTTDERPNLGAALDRVGFLGFAEFQCGGVVGRGDIVRVADTVIGSVQGFDDCHFPNHYNIVIGAEDVLSGSGIALAVEQTISFGDDEEV